MPDDRADELQKIAETIASFDPGRAERYSGVWLMQQSMERRLAQVVSDVHGHLDLSFSRDSRMGNGGELPFFAGVLVSIQECLGAIAQTLATADGAPKIDAVKIGPAVQMSMARLEPEPVRVALVPSAAVQEPFGKDEDRTLLELSIDRLIGLIDPGQSERQDFLADLDELGEKVRLPFAALAHWLAEGKADLTFDWSSRNMRKHAALTSYDATELGSALERAK
jgi:hypothetical protein